MKKSKLEELYSKFLLQRFPLSEGNKEVAAWIADLSEVEAYYANLAESLIVHKSFEISELPDLKPLSARLRKLKNEGGVSEELIQEYKDYLSGLNKLAKEITKVVSQLEFKV